MPECGTRVGRVDVVVEAREVAAEVDVREAAAEV